MRLSAESYRDLGEQLAPISRRVKRRTTKDDEAAN
jgi:hypothetical protein